MLVDLTTSFSTDPDELGPSIRGFASRLANTHRLDAFFGPHVTISGLTWQPAFAEPNATEAQVTYGQKLVKLTRTDGFVFVATEGSFGLYVRSAKRAGDGVWLTCDVLFTRVNESAVLLPWFEELCLSLERRRRPLRPRPAHPRQQPAERPSARPADEFEWKGRAVGDHAALLSHRARGGSLRPT